MASMAVLTVTGAAYCEPLRLALFLVAISIFVCLTLGILGSG